MLKAKFSILMALYLISLGCFTQKKIAKITCRDYFETLSNMINQLDDSKTDYSIDQLDFFKTDLNCFDDLSYLQIKNLLGESNIPGLEENSEMIEYFLKESCFDKDSINPCFILRVVFSRANGKVEKHPTISLKSKSQY